MPSLISICRQFYPGNSKCQADIPRRWVPGRADTEYQDRGSSQAAQAARGSAADNTIGRPAKDIAPGGPAAFLSVSNRVSRIPINRVMFNRVFERNRVPARPTGRRCWNVAGLACLLIAFCPSCGGDGAGFGPGASPQVFRGRDSAGATVELEMRADLITRAHVVDVVLGAADAEILSQTPRNLEFTIVFPAGATVTYIGSIEEANGVTPQNVAGTWTQHAEGIFGEDAGRWQAAADTLAGLVR